MQRQERAGSCLTVGCVVAVIIVVLIVAVCVLFAFLIRNSFQVVEEPAEVEKLWKDLTNMAVPENAEPEMGFRFSFFGNSFSTAVLVPKGHKPEEEQEEEADVEPEGPADVRHELSWSGGIVAFRVKGVIAEMERDEISVDADLERAHSEVPEGFRLVKQGLYRGKLGRYRAAVVLLLFQKEPEPLEPADEPADAQQQEPAEAEQREEPENAELSQHEGPDEEATGQEVVEEQLGDLNGKELLEKIDFQGADAVEVLVVLEREGEISTLVLRGPVEWVDAETFKGIVRSMARVAAESQDEQVGQGEPEQGDGSETERPEAAVQGKQAEQGVRDH